ncbi:hypothetical protein SCP_1103620 [Sparassis crispa]|uniref:Uncharacterized protein n=1 Tax=Sparassis crispa TaxID=139825 RepID=A0A401GZT9_9APHY|nr:hypothetical protein SCP_1103620 [Sparassis crispa]GBE87685.1 hypothetical protein SCP_1103620 [Sparassis crispa]
MSASSPSTRPWDVYAEQLSPCGYGYPLWSPEHAKHGGVHIGDVGYLQNGHFSRMFNAMRAKDDELNRYGVPEGYTPFTAGPYLKETFKDALPAGPLCSVGVKFESISTEHESKGVAGPLSFRCEKERGAILVMKEPATREEFHPSRNMMTYMRQNYKSWIDFAEKLGLQGVGVDDIMFVRGWVKTADWAVAVFDDRDHAKPGQLTFRGRFGVPANVAFMSDSSKGDELPVDCDSGPRRSTHARRASSLSSIGRGLLMKSPLERDQCVFLLYYRLKLRTKIPRKMKETPVPSSEDSQSSETDLLKHKPTPALGVQDELDGSHWSASSITGLLPFGRRLKSIRQDEKRKSREVHHHVQRASSGKKMVGIEPTHHRYTPYDPLTSVLDYILSKSDAKVAIATNTPELSYLSHDPVFPRNLHVRVDEGLAKVAYTSSYSSLNLRSAIHYCLHALPCEDLFDDYVICDNLAVLLSASYHELHDMEDLEGAIQWCKYSVDRRQPNHETRRIALLRNLTVLYQTRFKKTHHVEDLEEAIAYCREAQGHCPTNHIMYLSLVGALADLLDTRGSLLHRKDKREATKYREERATKHLPENYQEDPSYTETFVESWFLSGSAHKANSAQSINMRQLGTLLCLLGDWPSETRLKDIDERLDHSMFRKSESTISKDVFSTLIHNLHRWFHFDVQRIVAAIRCLTLPMGREGRYQDDPAARVLDHMLERACQTGDTSQTGTESASSSSG